MERSSIANTIKNRVEVLARTDHSVIYSDKSKPNVVLKAETIWIDGQPYGPPSRLAETSKKLCREYEIYKTISGSKCVTSCLGLVRDAEGNAIALKLERAPKGNLRQLIETSEMPPMSKRLEMACAFCERVAYLHSWGLIWGTLSTRNALVFGDDSLKICDLASAALLDQYPKSGMHSYELAYCPALPPERMQTLDISQREMYALGSAIYEITEWKCPYAEIRGDIGQLIESCTIPVITDTNLVRTIILRCWGSGYRSTEAILGDLHKIRKGEDINPEVFFNATASWEALAYSRQG